MYHGDHERLLTHKVCALGTFIPSALAYHLQLEYSLYGIHGAQYFEYF